MRLFPMSLIDTPMLIYTALVGHLEQIFSFVTWGRNPTTVLFLVLYLCAIHSIWLCQMRTSEKALTKFMTRLFPQLSARFSTSATNLYVIDVTVILTTYDNFSLLFLGADMLYSLKILVVNITFHWSPMPSLLETLMMDSPVVGHTNLYKLDR